MVDRLWACCSTSILATTETLAVDSGHPLSDPFGTGRTTVLVVDDEEMVRRLAARILRTQGYRVLEAEHGEQAVRMLQRAPNRINGVLTDVAMPGIGGRQLGETIARCWPWVKVLYMSGFSALRMVQEGELDPTHPFIPKPFTTEQLARKINELLAGPVEQ
jgi:two-component system, cell cycle sensor histidine kinase and response regulator CckA